MPSKRRKTDGPSRDRPDRPGRFRAWFARNRRDIRFLGIFGLIIAIYYASTLTPPVRDGFFPAYLRWNAVAAGAILQAFGHDVTVDGRVLRSAEAQISIERGCDAVDPSALFVAAVLASPVPWLPKIAAAVGGTILLMVLNFVRVISLFLVRVYWPDAFDVMHLDVWQVLFIFLAILLWGLWASRASRRYTQAHATA